MTQIVQPCRKCGLQMSQIGRLLCKTCRSAQRREYGKPCPCCNVVRIHKDSKSCKACQIKARGAPDGDAARLCKACQKAEVGNQSRSGFCEECRKRAKCRLCGVTSLDVAKGMCTACRVRMKRTSATSDFYNTCRLSVEDMNRRVEYYARRAELGLRIFEGDEVGPPLPESEPESRFPVVVRSVRGGTEDRSFTPHTRF